MLRKCALFPIPGDGAPLINPKSATLDNIMLRALVARRYKVRPGGTPAQQSFEDGRGNGATLNEDHRSCRVVSGHKHSKGF